MTTECTFVFADLAGYTALTEVHGDDDAARIATRFHDLARGCLAAGARIVKTIGDAVMIVSPTVSDGIEMALALVRTVAREPSFPGLRVGLHVGTAVERDNDYFGGAVNLAARVSGVARAGEILCTEPIAAIAVERGIACSQPLGTFRLKNIASSVSLYRLGGEAIGGLLCHIDPVCRMQVASDAADHVEFQGTTIYFCSTVCLRIFQQAPDTHVPTIDPAAPTP